MRTLYCFLLLIPSILRAEQASLCAHKRLFESSCDYFGEAGYRGPSPEPLIQPPDLVLYRDGTVIFEENGDFYKGVLTAKRLARIEQVLADSSILQRSAFLKDLPGEVPLMHGGLCHLAYFGGETTVVVAAMLVPSGGEWQRLVRAVRRRIPRNSQPYIPSRIKVRVTASQSHHWPVWPYEEVLDLARLSRRPRAEVTESGIVEFLFSRRPTTPTWYFNQGDASYKIVLLEVGCWYEPSELEEVIWEMLIAARAFP